MVALSLFTLFLYSSLIKNNNNKKMKIYLFIFAIWARRFVRKQ